MPSALTIRNAGITDIAVIQHIAYQTWPAAYGNILSEAQLDYMLEKMYSEKALQTQMEEGHQFFLAEKEEGPFGFASVSEEAPEIFKLNKLYVLPHIQKTGAGKALLKEVIRYARSNKGKRLQLQVNRHNAAKHFYINQGFGIIREADTDIGNGFFMNDFIMEKLL
ncbi:MAG: GNAT family N-acetyltransferase [Bacteroidota bacterium]|nr:GNAT family N-acetyltransferase [Bacteroidota bacterium]